VTRRLARAAVAVALGVALLTWLTRGIAGHELLAALSPVAWWAWPAAIVGLAASYASRALRIRAELRSRHPVSFRQCLEVMLVHNAAVNVVPMRGGEAAYPLLVHRRLGVPLAHAVGSLFWMRIQDALILALAALALWPGLPGVTRAAGAAALVALVVAALRILARIGARRAPGRPPPVPLRTVRAAAEALALAPRHGWAGWAWSAASWTSKLSALGLLLAALSGLGPRDAVTGALGGELAGVLPLQGPAGFGTYEGGVWAGAAVRGRSAVEIAAPAIAVHLLSLTTAVAAGALAHVLSRRHASPREIRHDPA
jgi:uncharacterized membrane protein YbhN (UPF0104 family)